MVLPDRDFQHLNNALDATLAHSPYDTTGPAGDLVNVFHRLQAMNAQTTADTTLKSDIWSTMMNTTSPATASVIGPSAWLPTTDLAAPLHHPKTARRRTPIWLSAAVILLLITLVASMYVPKGNPDNDSYPTILAPGMAQTNYLGPNIAECTTQPREPGSVAALAGQQATERPFLPRSGFDPAFESIDQPKLRPNAVDGNIVLTQTTELSDPDPGIEQLLGQLFACSPYGSSVGKQQYLDSQYYALFTEDFFRREFSGYLEAGVEPRLTGGWFPIGKPNLLDTRTLGDRVLLILQGRHETYDLLVIKKIGETWYVDEVGAATMPEGWDKAPTATATPARGDLPPGPYESDFVVRSASELPPPDPKFSGIATRCDQFPQAKDALCGYVSNYGPYGYSAYPPNIGLTLAFSNVSAMSMRIEIPEFRVSLDVPSGRTEAVTVSGDPGEYILLIYENGAADPSFAYVIEINQPGAPYPMG